MNSPPNSLALRKTAANTAWSKHGDCHLVYYSYPSGIERRREGAAKWSQSEHVDSSDYPLQNLSRIAAHTWHSQIARNPITQNDPLSPIRRSKINIIELDVLANSRRAAYESRDIVPVLATAAPPEVLEQDVSHVDARRVLGAGGLVDVEVALVEDDGPVGGGDLEVFEGDVVDVAIADIGACPSFQASAVLEMRVSSDALSRVRD